jgi:hypothetical protein
MKQLQKDTTTPEQSKRLLELGVPSDSANCYLTRFGIDEDWEVKVLNNIKYSELEISNQNYCLPCWSAARLIDIYEICTCCLFERMNPKLSVLEDVLLQISEDVISPDECWDFSKLED